jgi:hypothetical protein
MHIRDFGEKNFDVFQPHSYGNNVIFQSFFRKNSSQNYAAGITCHLYLWKIMRYIL